MAGDGLGRDATLCIDAFVEAMRRTLPPEQAGKLDRPEVRATLQPLGEAVYDIATGPAQAHSDAESDADFWAWVAATQAWIAGMEEWRRAIAASLGSLERRNPSLRALRRAARAAPPPPPPPMGAPTSLTGRVR